MSSHVKTEVQNKEENGKKEKGIGGGEPDNPAAELFVTALVQELYSSLSGTALKALTVTSRLISAHVREYILANFTFNVSDEEIVSNMRWYPHQKFRHVRWGPYMKANRSLLVSCLPSATHLSFSDYFNDPFGAIPPSIQQIIWGKSFNQPLPPLPQVTHLTFGDLFNQELVDLPQSRTHLKLGPEFRQTLSHLPHSITHLTLRSSSRPPFLPNLLYLNMDRVSFCSDFTCDLFPKSTCLILPPSYNVSISPLPHLRHLQLGNNFNHEIKQLPSLTHLIFTRFCAFNHSVDNLPPTLTHLSFGSGFNQSVDNLPPSLTYLRLGLSFNKPIISLPPTLKHLIFAGSFNQRIPFLPPALTHLTLLLKHRPISPFILPPTLIHLRVLIYPFTFSTLPPSLLYLTITSKIHRSNYLSPLPLSLLSLFLPAAKEAEYTLRSAKISFSGNTFIEFGKEDRYITDGLEWKS